MESPDVLPHTLAAGTKCLFFEEEFTLLVPARGTVSIVFPRPRAPSAKSWAFINDADMYEKIMVDPRYPNEGAADDLDGYIAPLVRRERDGREFRSVYVLVKHVKWETVTNV